LRRIGKFTIIGVCAVIALIALTVALVRGVDRKVGETASMAASPTSSLGPTAVPAPEPRRVVLIGDYTSGSEVGGEGPRNWTALVGLGLQTNQPTRVIRDNSEGSGYVANGAFGQTYLDAAKVLVSSDVSVVMMFGSRFDMYADPRAVRQAAADTYAAIRTAAPDAVLLVVGPVWPGVPPPGAILTTRDMVRAAAAEAGAVFVDPIEQGWFTEDPRALMGPDNVHPTDAGHERIALGIYTSLSEALSRQS
jgi:lysophospholipase L1-like esterase